MNSWDEEPLVRRISNEQNGDQDPIQQDHATPRHPRPKRPWLPLAISSLTVAVVVAVVSVLGGLRFDDPVPRGPDQFASRSSDSEAPDRPEPATTTTNTSPSRLDELLPDLSDRLTLIATTKDGVRSLIWDPAFRIPLPYDLRIPPLPEPEYATATFDSGGRSLAVLESTPSGRSIWAGTPTNIGESPDITRASSFVWHTTEVGAIAWMGFPGDDDSGLRTGSINPLSGNLVDVRKISDVMTPGGIVSWDSQGFIVNDSKTILAIDDDGSVAWERSGVAESASSSFVIAQVPDESGTLGWAVLDRANGRATTEIVSMPETSREGAWVTVSRSTGLIATVNATDERSSLTIRGSELSAPRIIQIDKSVLPFGFTSQGEYFVFKAADTNDLVFVNWRTGAIHPVPVPDEYSVIGLDLG